MKEIAGQLQSGNFSLTDNSYLELKRDYLALVVTVMDIVDGAAYLFDKKATNEDSGWKDSLEVEQYRHVLNLDIAGKVDKKGNGGCE